MLNYVSLSELHSMKKTSKDLTLDFFQKTFFPTFEFLISGCNLSGGAGYLHVWLICRC